MPVLTGRLLRDVTENQKAEVLRDLERVRPRDAETLHGLVKAYFGIDVPRVARVPGNDAPFEYLVHAFFEGRGDAKTQALGDESTVRLEGCAKPQAAGADVVVWACRDGGKTLLGAVATMMDLMFKPGIQVRVLAGSKEQASRMFEHLVRLAESPVVEGLLACPVTQDRVALVNGSRAELLLHSEAGVRGQRVHKLRCDELDGFESRSVWDAAQLTTKSERLGEVEVRGALEALSTFQKPYWLMSEATRRKGARVLRWNAIDVAATCPPEVPCETCAIRKDCGGLAKRGTGFVAIEDLLAGHERTGDEEWESEMMCLRPKRAQCVYPEFDPRPGGKHVLPVSVGGGASTLLAGVDTGYRELSKEWVLTAYPPILRSEWHDLDLMLAGIDFGTRNPLAVVWARFWPGAQGAYHVGAPLRDPRLGLLEIVDEYCESGRILDQHLHQIEARGWPKPNWVGVDPAGGATNTQTGVSDIRFLEQRGYKVLKQHTKIHEGVQMIRRRLDRGTLRIDPRCTQLIRALGKYHYNEKDPRNEAPVKDGPDHLCDALRYLVVNLEKGGVREVVVRRY